MSVEDVHLQVPLLAGADVAAVGAVPPAEGLHHHHVGQTILHKGYSLNFIKLFAYIVVPGRFMFEAD